MITKSQHFAKNSPTLSLTTDFSLKIDKKQPQRLSEIFPLLLGCHKELLVYYMGWWRTLCLEGNLEMADDLIDCLGIFDEGNDLHLTSTRRATDIASAIFASPGMQSMKNHLN
ncbi:MAG: hypothetical protein OEY25_05135 [Candidatus Aminicenantes bacterium]|nr:hypothetical protein [Candidatus Aminicenantes bacterium]